MKTILKDLKPNPCRNLEIDPVDEVAIASLKASIKEHGFWGGVYCVKRGDDIFVIAGWHRIKAAIKAGITEANLEVRNGLDDLSIIRAYTTENATQRGNHAVAEAGAVWAAIKFLVGSTNVEPENNPIQRITQGVGQTQVEKVLKGTGIGEKAIIEALASLKASREYDKLVGTPPEKLVIPRLILKG